MKTRFSVVAAWLCTVAAVAGGCSEAKPTVPPQSSRTPAPLHSLSSALPANLQVEGCEACGQMAVVPAGSFLMGTATDELGRYPSEGPQHEAKIQSFEIGRTEVTQGQWKAVMGQISLPPSHTGAWQSVKQFLKRVKQMGEPNNPSAFKACGDACPVENLSWNDAQAFIHELNTQTGQTYRLPTEAEWEYATRAGTKDAFWWGSSVTTEQANFDGTTAYNGGATGNNRKATVRCDAFNANAFGLYNVLGNVWEWTQDCWNPNYEAAPADGSAWLTGDCKQRVMRGGSWIDNPKHIRSGMRSKDTTKVRDFYAGFRLARSL